MPAVCRNQKCNVLVSATGVLRRFFPLPLQNMAHNVSSHPSTVQKIELVLLLFFVNSFVFILHEILSSGLRLYLDCPPSVSVSVFWVAAPTGGLFNIRTTLKLSQGNVWARMVSGKSFHVKKLSYKIIAKDSTGKYSKSATPWVFD